jgi:hypothetical protein
MFDFENDLILSKKKIEIFIIRDRKNNVYILSSNEKNYELLQNI